MKALNDFLGRQSWLADANMKLLAGPILILLILSMMVLPLPPFALDVFFTFNIALSIMVLLVSMFTQKPLDFAAFPAILLFTTLLRLSLNVASTRVVLMHGHEGGDEFPGGDGGGGPMTAVASLLVLLAAAFLQGLLPAAALLGMAKAPLLLSANATRPAPAQNLRFSMGGIIAAPLP